MDINAVKEKLAGIMAKVRDKAVTESEAHSAMEMARKLMAKYGVTLADLENDKAEAEIYRFKTHKDKKYLHEVDMFLSYAIANFCDVKPWRDGDVKGGMAYCGLQADIEFAITVRAILIKASEFEWGLYVDFEHTGPLKGARASFMRAFADRVSARMEENKTKTAHYNRDSKALIVLKGGLIERKMADEGISLGKGRSSRSTSWNAAAGAAGAQAGSRANWGTATGSGTAAQIGKS